MPVPLKISHTIGQREFAGPGFRSPCALAINDRLGWIYVVSRTQEDHPTTLRVTKCTLDEEYLGEFMIGSHDEVVWPTSIAIDRDDNVYIADEWLNCISTFTRDGLFMGKWGMTGSDSGQLKRPSGIAFNRDDHLLVVDASNNRIQKFTKDGRFLHKWGRAGNSAGEFNMPWGMDIDDHGDVYVADWRNDRVQKFTPDGAFLLKFGCSGREDGQFNRPTGVAVDHDGYIYVTDFGNDRLQMFESDGGHVATFLGEGTVSKWAKAKLDASPQIWKEREVAFRLDREKLFWEPIAVKVAGGNRVLVLERARHRIQVYVRELEIIQDQQLDTEREYA